MNTWRRAATLAAALAMLALLAVPASASGGATQIGGTGGFHAVSDGVDPAFTDQCPEPAGTSSVDGIPYSDFDMLTLLLDTGNLQGCWYTLIEEYKFSPNVDASPVVFQERGREVFVGSWYDDDGNLVGDGTFETTYKFTAKFADASLAVEIHGRCQHPIVAGTGTGVFDGATGRIDFKDDVDTGVLTYRGHISVP